MNWNKNKIIIEKLCSENFTKSEVLRQLGLRPVGGNMRTLSNYIDKFNIDISHFTGRSTNRQSKHNIDLFSKNSVNSSTTLYNAIIKDSLIPLVCATPNCNVSISWLGQPIRLHLDHIDGIRSNNKLNNLRFLCPNCHSQTSTYCGRNNRTTKLKENLKCCICQKDTGSPFRKYCSVSCRSESYGKPTVLKTTLEEMKKMVWVLPIYKIAKKLKCSKRKVVKFCEDNNIKRPERGYFSRK